MTQNILMEVCIDSVESALNAIRGGANRLELCGNVGLGGGTTPSFGLVRIIHRAVESFQVPIMVMIRPRTGDFLYSESEMQVMLEDIRIFKEMAGVEGFVFGVLTKEGRVDVTRTRRYTYLKNISPFELTIRTTSPLKARRCQSSCTSGQYKSASQTESLETLASLLLATRNSSLTIMPGSGINPHTVRRVVNMLAPLGLSEIHLSGGRWTEGGMIFHGREGMGMGIGAEGDWGIWQTDEGVIREVRALLESM
ncbi:copper homeostasis CutC domain-containing protein [Lentinula raphanica]|nr:copper homeostasis CutC domain-containing protein [Lentinula raphanica]